jgi:hypothetical protein
MQNTQELHLLVIVIIALLKYDVFFGFAQCPTTWQQNVAVVRANVRHVLGRSSSDLEYRNRRPPSGRVKLDIST